MANSISPFAFSLDDSIPPILLALAYAKRALSLSEVVHETDLPVQSVAQGLDQLVMLQFISSATSYARSELGEIVYAFADNPIARALYHSIVKEED